jgi:hypothetical protein
MTDNVGRGAELPMWEGLNWAEINGRARVVGKYDLGNTVSSQSNDHRKCRLSAT